MKRIIKSLTLVLLVVLAATSIVGCGNKKGDKSISIGSKGLSETNIVSELYALALEDAGYTVDRESGMSTKILHTAIQAGELDLYPEYTGTGLIAILGKEALTDPDEVYNVVKEEYKSQFDLVWLEPSKINDSTCMVMRRSQADELGIKNLSDLQKYAAELVLGDSGGWSEREDNLPTMDKLYGEFSFKKIVNIDGGLSYEALENGDVDVIPGFTTAPQLLDDKFIVLEENITVWPPYYLTPIVRQEVLDKNPEIEEILNKVSSVLDNDTIIELISKVEIDGEDYEDVAKEFYEKNIK